MIIIEGVDNSGKSTLAERLSRELEVPVRHSQRPDPKLTPIQALEQSSRLLRPQRAILDRVYAISENVYGPVIRGRSQLGIKAEEALLDLYQRPYLIIYCRPPTPTILKNAGRAQMPGVIEYHPKLIKAYDALMEDVCKFSNCQVIYFDWHDKLSYDSLYAKCRDYMTRFDQSRWSATFNGMSSHVQNK